MERVNKWAVTDGWSFGSDVSAAVMVPICSCIAARFRLADCDAARFAKCVVVVAVVAIGDGCAAIAAAAAAVAAADEGPAAAAEASVRAEEGSKGGSDGGGSGGAGGGGGAALAGPETVIMAPGV